MAGFTILDKPSSIRLLLELRKSRKPYAAGTLKAILANAIKTAVLFHKAKLTDSPICPFCDNNCYEDTPHMFEICPRWDLIRRQFFPSLQFDDLPTCTRMTGIACLPTSAVDVFRSFALQSQPDILEVDQPPVSIPAL